MLGVHSLAPVKLYVGTTTVKTKPTIRRVASAKDDQPREAGPIHQRAGVDESPMAEQVQDAPARGRPVEAVANGNLQDMADGPTTVGPSRPLSQTVHPSSDPEPSAIDPEMASAARPDETHANAITYRRDPETVIAYLVPLPQPTVQGKALPVPLKYFLYAPPPPHLVKPAHGSEGYAVRLTRHWQQSVRRAKINAHNGKKMSWRGVRSKGVRALVWGLNKLKYDDVAFLARVHPKTVTHLILIHPSDLSGTQTPEEILSTFRAQIFESKKRAKRNSIISAALFLPALAIDTAAVFFGGLAEIDGIWMLVSITAYRTARLITQKMGPDPKTLQISQEKLIENAQRDNTRPDKEASDDESETGAIRKSVDALRRGVGSVKQRMSLQKRRKARKSESGDRTSTDDTSRPQTHASQGFVGGGLGDHAEEAGDPPSVAPSELSPTTVTPTQNATDRESGEELSGMLEHGVEEEEEEAHANTSSRRPTGGIFQDDSAGEGMSTASEDDSAIKNKGQNFQLTFYPSPAMDILDRYMRQSCHLRNGQAFTDATVPPTEAEVLAVMGWSPERRQHQTAELQQEDEQWQAREAEDDLRLVAAKAAKSWDKACRKEAKRGGSTKGVGFLRPRASKGKTKQPSLDSGEQRVEEEKRSGLKQRLGGMRSKSDRGKQGENTRNDRTSSLKAAGAAALLCIPCIAVSQRVKRKKRENKSEKATDGKTNNKFSALKERVKALRIRVIKRVRGLRQKRKSKATPGQSPDRDVKSAKTHSAMVGLVAGCLAMPGAKVKELRDKRRANRGEEAMMDNMPARSTMSEQRPTTTTPNITLMPQPPIPIPEEEDEPDVPQARETQYLPGHGQSEIPVSPERSAAPELGNHVEPHSAEEEDEIQNHQISDERRVAAAPAPSSSSSSAAAVKFKSLRDGMSNFTTRTSRREHNNNTAEETAAGMDGLPQPEPSSPLAPLGGSPRFALKNFRARRGGNDDDTMGHAAAAVQSPQQHQEGAHHADLLDAGIEGATAEGATAVGEDTAAEPTKPKFGNLGFMKRKGGGPGGEKPLVVKDKVYKDSRNPGFADRMRAMRYIS